MDSICRHYGNKTNYLKINDKFYVPINLWVKYYKRNKQMIPISKAQFTKLWNFSSDKFKNIKLIDPFCTNDEIKQKLINAIE